jgi:hypothetical protein
MDRRSFIDQNFQNSIGVGPCGGAICECNTPVSNTKKILFRKEQIRLVAIFLLAFACSSMLMIVKYTISNAGTADGSRNQAIGCVPADITRYIIKAKGNNDQRQHKGDGNSCPHGVNGLGIICCIDQKRKRNEMG